VHLDCAYRRTSATSEQPRWVDPFQGTIKLCDLVAPVIREAKLHPDAEAAAAEDALPRKRLSLCLADERKERWSNLGPENLVGGNDVEIATNHVSRRWDVYDLLDKHSRVLLRNALRREPVPQEPAMHVAKRVDTFLALGRSNVLRYEVHYAALDMLLRGGSLEPRATDVSLSPSSAGASSDA